LQLASGADPGRDAAIVAIHDPDAVSAILAAVHSDKWSIQATGPPDDNPQLATAAA